VVDGKTLGGPDVAAGRAGPPDEEVRRDLVDLDDRLAGRVVTRDHPSHVKRHLSLLVGQRIRRTEGTQHVKSFIARPGFPRLPEIVEYRLGSLDAVHVIEQRRNPGRVPSKSITRILEVS